MNAEDKARKRAEEIVAFAEKILGPIDEMSEEEATAFYSESVAEVNPTKAIYQLAAKAAQQYRLRGQLVPPHVQAAFEATKQDADLEAVKQSTLQEIIEKMTVPFTGPVQDVSYAYRDKKELSGKDREILDDASKEMQEDWEKDKP